MTLARSAALIRQSKLVSNVGVYAVGNMLMRLAGIVLIPIYTRFLTPEDYGITGLVIAFEGVLVAILGLGIYGSITRYYYEYAGAPERQSQFITTNFLFVGLFSVTFALVASLWGDGIWSRITSGNIPYSPYVEIVVWSSVFTVLSRIPFTIYRAEQRANAFMTARISQFVIGVTISIFLIVGIGLGALGQLLARLITLAVITVILVGLMLRRWYSPKLRMGDIFVALRFGAPLVPHLLFGWALASIDRLILVSRIPLADLGLYNLGYSLGSIMAMLVTSFNMAWMPYYYDIMGREKSPETTVKRVAEVYTGFFGAICLFGILFGREILVILATDPYIQSAQYVPLILFGYLFNGYYFLASAPLFFFKKTLVIPLMTLIAAIINILLNLWLVPLMGALGAAWATLVSFITILVVALYLGRRQQVIHYRFARLALVNALIFVAVMFTTYLPYEGPIFFLLRVVWFALFCFTVFYTLIRPNATLFQGLD